MYHVSLWVLIISWCEFVKYSIMHKGDVLWLTVVHDIDGDFIEHLSRHITGLERNTGQSGGC